MSDRKMSLEVFTIRLQPAKPIYYPGQKVTGFVDIKLEDFAITVKSKYDTQFTETRPEIIVNRWLFLAITVI